MVRRTRRYLIIGARCNVPVHMWAVSSSVNPHPEAFTSPQLTQNILNDTFVNKMITKQRHRNSNFTKEIWAKHLRVQQDDDSKDFKAFAILKSCR